MHNLLKILQQYSNFLVFIALEVAAFLLVSFNNVYPRSSLFSTANQTIAWQHEQIHSIKEYFSLRSVNEELAAENALLRSRIASLEDDSVITYHPAKVVYMTTDRLHNYLTVNLGERDGVRRGQGVRNTEGAVGIIQTVGRNYSIVLPLINTRTNLSCRFLKNDYIGTLQWDGKDSRYALLADVASHMTVNAGDTIVTSGLSPVFPIGIPVGIVESSTLEKGASYHTIRVRLHTNFKRLNYVEVIHNSAQEELEKLEYGLD